MKELVHIFLITYNHKNYISKAIDSVLMQKTAFNYKLIIGEDCSTDGTNEIVKQYANSYPDRITAFLNEKNLGIKKNADQVFNACTAKYIAMLEGDDYWTDPYKLQKQVDFLEANPDFSMVFHNALAMESIKLTGKNFLPHLDKSVFDTEDTLYPFRSFAPTASILFRNNLLTQFPDWFSSCAFGDRMIFTMLSKHGKIKYLNFAGAVRRIQPGSISLTFTPLSNTLNRIVFFKNMPSYIGKEYKPLCDRYLKYYYEQLIWYYFSNQASDCLYFNSIIKGLKSLLSSTYLSLWKVKSIKNEKNFIKFAYSIRKKIVSKFKKKFLTC